MERIEAHAVNEIRWPLDIPDGEVAELGRLERPDLVEAPQGPRSFPRDARDTSSTVRRKRGPMFIASRSEVSGDVPGLQSVAPMWVPCRRNRSIGGR